MPHLTQSDKPCSSEVDPGHTVQHPTWWNWWRRTWTPWSRKSLQDASWDATPTDSNHHLCPLLVGSPWQQYPSQDCNPSIPRHILQCCQQWMQGCTLQKRDYQNCSGYHWPPRESHKQSKQWGDISSTLHNTCSAWSPPALIMSTLVIPLAASAGRM